MGLTKKRSLNPINDGAFQLFLFLSRARAMFTTGCAYASLSSDIWKTKSIGFKEL